MPPPSSQPFRWMFDYFRQLHIRKARSNLFNVLRFSGRPKRAHSFCKDAARIFGNLVHDPADFDFGDPGMMLCIPQSIVLGLLVGVKGVNVAALTRHHLHTAVESLVFKPVLRSDDGISLNSLSKIEELNRPFPPSLLAIIPELSRYEGLAISVFRGKLVRDKSTGVSQLSLSPKLLSRRHCDSNFKSIDLLVDSPTFRDANNNNDNNHDDSRNTNKTRSQHILTITSLVRLCALRNRITKAKAPSYQFVCRRCLSCFRLEEELNRHTSLCNAFAVGRCFQPKRASNIKVFHPFRKNRYTGRMERNYIQFPKGHTYRSLKPLHSSFLGELLTKKDKTD